MTEDEQKRRADNSRRLLDDPTLKEAFATLRERFTHHIIGSELSQADKREHAFRMMKALEEVWFQLQSWVNEGKLIDDRRKLRKQTPDFRSGLNGNDAQA